MPERNGSRRLSLAIIVSAVCLFITSQITHGARAQSAAEDITTEQVYKNIQTLQGMSAAEIDGAMFFMSAALGVSCDFCHAGAWESDAKPAKLVTRKMVEMTRRINKESFSGNPVVNCFTCHQGRPQTVTLPPITRDALPVEPEATAAKPIERLPSADRIIDRYTQAIGGKAAIEKLKTVFWRGQLTTTDRMSPQQTLNVEAHLAAPDRRLIAITTESGIIYQGYDGTSGWVKDSRGKRKASGEQFERSRHGAEFFRFLNIKASYPSMRVLGKERIENREAYRVGATSKDDERETLYFDVETGLLIRRYVIFKTALGSIPEATDFYDYKNVNGVRLPFAITWSRAPFTAAWKLSEAKTNVAIDDARFRAPSGD